MLRILRSVSRIRVGVRGFRIIRKPVRDLYGKVAKLNSRQRINFTIVKTTILLSVVFRPRDCGLHGEAFSDDRGGDILVTATKSRNAQHALDADSRNRRFFGRRRRQRYGKSGDGYLPWWY